MKRRTCPPIGSHTDGMDRGRLSRAVIDLAHDAAEGVSVFPDVLDALDRHIGADTLSDAHFAVDGSGPADIDVRKATPPDDEETAEWMRLIGSHPYARWLETAPLGTSRLTDVVDLSTFERSVIYQRLLRPRGHRYQTALLVERCPEAMHVVSLWRSCADFTDAEVEALEMARRLLVAGMSYRAAIDEARAFGGPVDSAELSPRQREVVGLVSRGLTNDQIARRLDISSRTVRKHLEQAFGATGCHSRTAVAMWWRQGGRRAT